MFHLIISRTDCLRLRPQTNSKHGDAIIKNSWIYSTATYLLTTINWVQYWELAIHQKRKGHDHGD